MGNSKKDWKCGEYLTVAIILYFSAPTKHKPFKFTHVSVY
jgi:hypothetical protein